MIPRKFRVKVLSNCD